MDPNTHILKSNNKCEKKWNNQFQKWNAMLTILISFNFRFWSNFCSGLVSRKGIFLEKAIFLSRFIPDILIYSGYSGFGGYVLFRNVPAQNIYPLCFYWQRGVPPRAGTFRVFPQQLYQNGPKIIRLHRPFEPFWDPSPRPGSPEWAGTQPPPSGSQN